MRDSWLTRARWQTALPWPHRSLRSSSPALPSLPALPPSLPLLSACPAMGKTTRASAATKARDKKASHGGPSPRSLSSRPALPTPPPPAPARFCAPFPPARSTTPAAPTDAPPARHPAAPLLLLQAGEARAAKPRAATCSTRAKASATRRRSSTRSVRLSLPRRRRARAARASHERDTAGTADARPRLASRPISRPPLPPCRTQGGSSSQASKALTPCVSRPAFPVLVLAVVARHLSAPPKPGRSLAWLPLPRLLRLILSLSVRSVRLPAVEHGPVRSSNKGFAAALS